MFKINSSQLNIVNYYKDALVLIRQKFQNQK